MGAMSAISAISATGDVEIRGLAEGESKGGGGSGGLNTHPLKMEARRLVEQRKKLWLKQAQCFLHVL